jgi:hypothetical protein
MNKDRCMAKDPVDMSAKKKKWGCNFKRKEKLIECPGKTEFK